MPSELTTVTMDALVNDGAGNATVVGVINGIVRAMAVVSPIMGATMCDGLRTKICLYFDRLTSPHGKGTEKPLEAAA
jgi:hypothetical protein